MKQLIRAATFCLVTLCFFLPVTVKAQVQTARSSVYVSSRCNGYYEYLPQGYDPAGTTTYPLMIFISGIGEFGNGTSSQLPRILKNGPPKLINAGVWPTSFSVLGQTHKFIVISPQFTATPVSAADVDTVIRYMIARYKVNTSRVYLTGLSYGGGLSFAHPGNATTSYASRITAIVPIASPLPLPGVAVKDTIKTGYDTIYARSRRIAAANIAVWALHNSGDTPDSAARTIAYVNNINLSPAPNPLAKKTIFSAGGHDAWTKAYDPDFRENGYSVYEWMLLYQKGVTPATLTQPPTANAGADKTVALPTNSVTLTATGSDPEGGPLTYSWKQLYGPSQATFGSPNAASNSLTGLVQGYYNFRVTVSDDKGAKAIDDVKVTVTPNLSGGAKLIQVNVYGGSNAYNNTAWNNWSVGTAAATNKTSAAFKYSDGTTSTVSAVLSATSTVNDNLSTCAGGIAPPEVLRYTSYHTASRTLTINGLSTAKSYDLEFYASRASSTAGSTIFSVNGIAITVNTYNNFTSKASFANVKPNASGQIVVTIDKATNYNYLNGFALIEKSTATVTTKYVKANIYGGTNPYNNAEWNNWNTAASKTVTALKYSDATTSTINAVFSGSYGTADNGSTYGGTMAPPEVLRYGSYGVLRTLTLSGLSTSKTYNLELYATRGSTGNSTIFKIGTTSITIVTDYNKTNKAVFTGLVPSSTGQIVITIDKVGTYNFVNGFILTENSAGAVTEASSTPQGVIAESNAGDEDAAAVQVFPNPVSSTIQLQLRNSYKGEVQVQVADAVGRVQETWRFLKNAELLQQSLPVQGLSKGIYFVTVRMGSAQQTRSVSKVK